ncbi:hypothetical protein BDF20DRAFT_478380 [Mycotypha africana]|uniref:uncharacterized protein n=1 Tax=Mycotypha africana TaxID=64632 RepID=UPI0022FFDE97|nr:uncharacterized protein BDF20DRAFT_478380 [Mycotypha africana]KAI8979069.1 hypothetical protein BDF20DRAFT_478380 [Mycotypha africana]
MDSLFSMPPNSPTTQPKQSSNVSLTQSQAIAQPTTSISTINSNLSTPTSTITSVPNASNDNTINTNTSNSQQIVLPPISAATIHPATSTSTTNDQLIHYGAPATPSLNQVTNNLSSIASSAESINQDIDELGLSLQALAEHLGFDPSKLITEGDSVATNSIANADTGDLIDMDDFLNAYGSDIPDMTSTADTPATPLSAATDTAKVTTTNSTSSATQTPSMPRSPSPAVAGNNLS